MKIPQWTVLTSADKEREITSKWDKLKFPEMDGKGVEVRIIKEENYVLDFLFLCLWLQHYKNSLHDTLVV